VAPSWAGMEIEPEALRRCMRRVWMEWRCGRELVGVWSRLVGRGRVEVGWFVDGELANGGRGRGACFLRK
jgi:hypothetical protein